MRLQGMSAQHHRNLVERKPVQGLTMSDGRENVLCQLRYNQVFDEEDFLEAKSRRHIVVSRDLFKNTPCKVIVQVVEWSPDPHLHSAIQIEKCCGERYGSRDPNLPPVVEGMPLSDRGWRQGDATEDGVIRRILGGLFHFSWAGAKSRN